MNSTTEYNILFLLYDEMVH